MKKWFLVILCALTCSLFGATPKNKETDTRHFLMDAIVNQGKEVSGKLLPSRVYFHFVPSIEKGKWVQVLTTPEGKYPWPLEVLLEGTVLKGKDIGAEDASARYRLNDEGKWIATNEKEIYRVYVVEKIPKLRVMDFQEEDRVPVAPHP